MDRGVERLVRRRQQAVVLLGGPSGLGRIADSGGDVTVGGQTQHGLVVVDGPIALEVDVVGGLHDARRAGPIGRDGVGGCFDAGLGRTLGTVGPEVLLHEGKIPGLQQIGGPQPRVGPYPVVVLACGSDHRTCFEQERMSVGELTLGEEVGEDADDVVAVLGLVAVDAGVHLVAAPGDFGVDEAAPIGIVQGGIGNVDVGDAGQLVVPEVPHVVEMLIEAPGVRQGQSARPGIGVPEPVGGHDVVVLDRRMRLDRVRRPGERDHARGGIGCLHQGVVGRDCGWPPGCRRRRRRGPRGPAGRRTR